MRSRLPQTETGYFRAIEVDRYGRHCKTRRSRTCLQAGPTATHGCRDTRLASYGTERIKRGRLRPAPRIPIRESWPRSLLDYLDEKYCQWYFYSTFLNRFWKLRFCSNKIRKLGSCSNGFQKERKIPRIIRVSTAQTEGRRTVASGETKMMRPELDPTRPRRGVGGHTPFSPSYFLLCFARGGCVLFGNYIVNSLNSSPFHTACSELIEN
jgi:hypothetical protein